MERIEITRDDLRGEIMSGMEEILQFAETTFPDRRSSDWALRGVVEALIDQIALNRIVED